MLARWIRAAQLLELLGCLAAGAWLHASHGWGALAVALGVAGWFAGIRFALVCVSVFLGWIWRSPRPPEQRIGIAGTLRLLLGEWWALLAFNLVYLPWERRVLRPDPAPQPTARVPVILVHGYFANRGYFRPLVRKLEARGVGPVFVPNFTSWLAPIETFEAQLHAQVERIVAGTGQARVVLVAHSMGGLAARAYLARRGTARVARLVTIASPHHGTAFARLGAGENARQMEQGSAFLAALERAESAAGERVEALSVYSPHDNMVAPQASSRLAWARNMALPGHGHIELGASEALASVLLPELEAAGAVAAR